MAESAEGWLSRCIAGDDRDAPRKGGNIVPCTRALLLECSGAQSDSLSPLRRRDAEEDSQNSEGAEMAESAEGWLSRCIAGDDRDVRSGSLQSGDGPRYRPL